VLDGGGVADEVVEAGRGSYGLWCFVSHLSEPPPILFAQNPGFKEFSLVPSKTQLFGSSRVPDSISTSILEDRGKLIGTFRGGCKAKRWKSLERFDDARGLDSVENGE
jgi:hypothetical protein